MNQKFILVLDDDMGILRFIEKTLKNSGCIITAYSLPDYALECFQHSSIPYSLIITNIDMPVMNGVDFIKKAKDIRPGIKTIGMSGSHHKNLGIDIFDKFIEKPFTIQTLCNAVNKVLISD